MYVCMYVRALQLITSTIRTYYPILSQFTSIQFSNITFKKKKKIPKKLIKLLYDTGTGTGAQCVDSLSALFYHSLPKKCFYRTLRFILFSDRK